jgi:hypothetical protein
MRFWIQKLTFSMQFSDSAHGHKRGRAQESYSRPPGDFSERMRDGHFGGK